MMTARVKHVKAREVRSDMWPHFIRRSQWVLIDMKTREFAIVVF